MRVFSHYSFRHMIEWKDLVYCDIDYLLQDENTQTFKANLLIIQMFHADTSATFLASIHFAGKKNMNQTIICNQQ